MTRKPNEYFKEGAWLCSGLYHQNIGREMSESTFIKFAGGIDKVMEYYEFPFVSIVMDDPYNPFLVGHPHGNSVGVTMTDHGHYVFQTMEWKNRGISFRNALTHPAKTNDVIRIK